MDEELRIARLNEALRVKRSEGWTIERIAAEAGMRSQALHAYKSGKRPITERAARKLAPILGVPVAFLLGLDEEPDGLPEGCSRELLDEHDRFALEIYRALFKRDREATKFWLALGTIAAEHRDFRSWLKMAGRMAAKEYELPLEASSETGTKAAPRRRKAKGA